jgi:integrase
MSRQRTTVRQAQAYLEYRRALGYDLRNIGGLLLRFAEFVDQSGWRGPLTTDLILRWVNLPKAASARYKASRLSAARGFARYLATRDGRTEVPYQRLMPKTFRSRPHLFAEGELEQLLEAAQRLRPTYRLRPLTYRTLFGLLASTGLRVGEALRLTLGQVDLERGILRIEQTKFKKSRLVPLHPTATRALRRYAAARGRLWGHHEDEPFFVGPRGSALSHRCVLEAFRTLCMDLGWQRGNGDWPRPRIHDLRHNFACCCLLRWYRDGENVHHRIAALSTYLGHACVTNTYWYLTATPELLAIAASRFERFATPLEGRHS